MVSLSHDASLVVRVSGKMAGPPFVLYPQAVLIHTFNPSTPEARTDHLCEFNATLGYLRLIQSKRETESGGDGSHL